MRLITLAVLASTALVPAAAMAQGAGGQNQPNQAGQASQGRQIAASDLEGREVYTPQGQTIGQIDSVVLGQNNQTFAVVSFDEFLGLGGEARLVPLSRMMLQGDRAIVSNMSEADYRSLRSYRPNMAGFREAGEDQLIALGGDGRNMQQAGSRILVQQAAPTVRVDPADPRVIVRQQQPQVTVNQAQPEILVRQPQPTVRVDIPQPEIIVRMPQPDVNVALAQPQVQVRQPQPQVQVTQPQQPQVQVERSQPQVMVQRQAGSEAQVQVQRAEGQPTVRYERAEPRVVVNQAEGQPNVRIERQGEGQQASAQTQEPTEQQTASNQAADTARISDPAALGGTVAPPPPSPEAQSRQAAAGSVYSEDQRRIVRERVNEGDVQSTGSITADAEMRPLAVSQLEDMDVYNARGNELGEVERVIVTPQGRRFVVVEAGGFLGIGSDRVAFPLERFWMRGDRLVIRGVTEEDIEAMDDYRDTVDNFERVGRTEQAELRVWE
ncbi:PRC-barrel domain-containing protein [Microvirga splendida]|uniref:PRC-barrel domain-containing protein n=1 Tax=Microvirga splendida TaxID=2795727 RepID=A0ABS0Y3E8_9HYPH|nr:PRC-barrel domain-containing protein [Microvirga splendida]MBJ6126811.1 PRC-barrel domain-containing protein [Microvirga splendida]